MVSSRYLCYKWCIIFDYLKKVSTTKTEEENYDDDYPNKAATKEAITHDISHYSSPPS